jgi:catechol 2,3-dioxygenase-like lactoylglutathione lyase family enzyme
VRTKIQHVAIVSENFVRETKFYEAVLGMERSKPGSAEEEKAVKTNYALSISDGYVGMTVIGRKPGYIPGLHHFGIDVDDVEEACARIKQKYPAIAVLKRPSNRPFATFGAHDPEGNYFDLTQEGMENRRDVYAVRPSSPQVEATREQPRCVHHIKLRVMNPTAIAAFYGDLFDLKEEDKALEDPNFYLTDGKVTLIIAPWKMSDFAGAGIDRPGIEHIGCKVESVESVKKELAALRESDPAMREPIVSVAEEGERRLALIASCRYGQHVFSDPDGVFIDIAEGSGEASLSGLGFVQ